MNIELVRATNEYKEQLFEMLTEWKNDIIVNHTDMSPWKIWANDFHDFDNYLKNLDTKEETKDGWVPDTTLFCFDRDRKIFVGAVNIRHYLNDKLLKTGGHIGDGVRPSERKKGYATAMIGLALDECKRLGINKVLICCDKNNIGSAKSIINNGGILETPVYNFWIFLNPDKTYPSIILINGCAFFTVSSDSTKLPNIILACICCPMPDLVSCALADW